VSAPSIPFARRLGLARGDVVAAGLWVVLLVPPSMGFWIVAGDLAGISGSGQRQLILASLLGLGLATLAQAVAGYRLPVFEGPASTYFAAIAVLAVASTGASPEQITGGLLVAGASVFALGLLGADRALGRLFTPAVVSAFLLIVVIAVVPATLERAIGRTAGASWGSVEAWASAAVVIAAGLVVRRVPALRSYALLIALVLGTLMFWALAGMPDRAVHAGLVAPELFPWGAPEISAAALVPFLAAALLSSFNTIASVRVMGDAVGRRASGRDERSGLVVHGAAQATATCFGNLLGNVPRLDSVGAIRMIGNDRREALILASIAIIALAFMTPAVDVLALLPIAVSAALLVLVLGMLAAEGVRHTSRLHRTRRWLVVAPAVAPTVVWIAVADRLPPLAQVVANPLLVGVVLAVVLDRLCPPDPTGEPT
jgi:xanthine/uracil permease